MEQLQQLYDAGQSFLAAVAALLLAFQALVITLKGAMALVVTLAGFTATKADDEAAARAIAFLQRLHDGTSWIERKLPRVRLGDKPNGARVSIPTARS